MRRSEKKMKYWGFYTTEELKAQTIECAKAANESDSEYIRKAVEMRNDRNRKGLPDVIETLDPTGKSEVEKILPAQKSLNSYFNPQPKGAKK